MKQENLFGLEFETKEDTIYTQGINTPIYKPRGIRPNILELYDTTKTRRLITEIESSTLPDEEKKFLIEAAKRHTVFNYEAIADYYANATLEMQQLMEKSALVIIDFNKAFLLGYINLAHEIANQYFDQYGE